MLLVTLLHAALSRNDKSKHLLWKNVYVLPPFTLPRPPWQNWWGWKHSASSWVEFGFNELNWFDKSNQVELDWTEPTFEIAALYLLWSSCSALLLCFHNETLSLPVTLSVGNTDQSRCPHLADCFSLNQPEWLSLLFSPALISPEFYFSLKHVYMCAYVFVCASIGRCLTRFSLKTCWKGCLAATWSCCYGCVLKAMKRSNDWLVG